MNQDDQTAIELLISDLHWQIDQMGPRGIKNATGHTYNPSYYKRGLNNSLQRGGLEPVEYVRGYLYKPPSDGYKKLEDADALDLACEALVEDAEKPYAHLFTDGDRQSASKRLAPHKEAIEKRKAERRASVDEARARFKETGLPSRPELEAALRSRYRKSTDD